MTSAKPGHLVSRQFLEVVRDQALPVIVPHLVLVEVAGAISRTRQAPVQAQAFAIALSRLTHVTVRALDEVCAPHALTLAAQHATRTIPIVFVNVADPVGKGIVASLAQPDANVTGVTYVPTLEINQKRLELFTEAVPQMSLVAVLWNPNNPIPALPLVEQAARALGVPLHLLAVRDLTELEQAFHAITDKQDNGLFFMGDPFLFVQRRRIAQFAFEHRLPTMFPESGYVEEGGLMAYGLFIPDMFRRAAAIVVKILRGAKTTDLPVEQPMKLELVINLRTAKELGLTIPATLLFQADKVMQ